MTRKDYIRDHGIDFKQAIQRYQDLCTWPGDTYHERMLNRALCNYMTYAYIMEDYRL